MDVLDEQLLSVPAYLSSPFPTHVPASASGDNGHRGNSISSVGMDRGANSDVEVA